MFIILYHKKNKSNGCFLFHVNAFSLFVGDSNPDLKIKAKNKKSFPTELVKFATKEWKNKDGVSQSKYGK